MPKQKVEKEGKIVQGSLSGKKILSHLYDSFYTEKKNIRGLRNFMLFSI